MVKTENSLTLVEDNGIDKLRQLKNKVTMVAHFVCLLFTAFIVYTAQPGSSLFSWHPTLMSLAVGITDGFPVSIAGIHLFTFFMVQAILAFSSESSIVSGWQRVNKVRLHWILMLSSLACATFGLLAIMRNKYLSGKEHFTTWHGQVGLSTVIYTAIQCCAGTILLYPRIIPKAVGTLWQVKQMHATSGLILYTLVSTSLVLGMFSTWFTKNVTGTSWYMCIACPMILVLVTMQQITSHYLPKRRVVSDRKGGK